MKIPISSDQRKALLLSLAKGSFNIEVFPELAERMPNAVAWYSFISGISGEYHPAALPLDRPLKIAALKMLKSGYFNIADFTGVIEADKDKNYFLSLMQAASATDADEW
ncbi:hypothetical protein LJC45_02720 [Alistipes sp. OttesenSCG-928-B03]|nr:hypothetical protein [Alistipes sp. OttesenSCG-928-B03]